MINTPLLIKIVEAMEGCQSKDDFSRLNSIHGRETILEVWNEFLTDSFKAKIYKLCS